MTQGSRSEKNAQSESQCYKRPLIVLKIKYSTTFKLVGLCVVSCVGREIPQRDPTGLFTILYPSDQEIGEFHLPQRCRTKHFEATKLWKDWSWWIPAGELTDIEPVFPGFIFPYLLRLYPDRTFHISGAPIVVDFLSNWEETIDWFSSLRKCEILDRGGHCFRLWFHSPLLIDVRR